MKHIFFLTITCILGQFVLGQQNTDREKIVTGTYQPVQHFVFPKTQFDRSTRVAQSVIERAKFHQYVFNFAYTACIDTEFQLPIWVSHHVNKSLLTNIYNKRPSNYPRDLQTPIIKTDAYEGSGYDHGHLAPAADFRWNKEAFEQSHFMSNMSPQHGCFNQKGWCHLEATVRKWVEEDSTANAYVVSGAFVDEFIDTLCVNKQLRVFVPRYFYKVVLVTSKLKENFAIGFKIPNSDISNDSLQQYACTVRTIEEQTNLDFFTFLPRSEQDSLEEKLPTVKFYSGTLDCPNKSCESTYNGRIKPENRTKLKCD